jgi:hypothetical protein
MLDGKTVGDGAVLLDDIVIFCFLASSVFLLIDSFNNLAAGLFAFEVIMPIALFDSDRVFLGLVLELVKTLLLLDAETLEL